MDVFVMAMKGYSTFLRVLGQNPCHQMQFSVDGVFIHLQKYSRCILQPYLTGLHAVMFSKLN